MRGFPRPVQVEPRSTPCSSASSLVRQWAIDGCSIHETGYFRISVCVFATVCISAYKKYVVCISSQENMMNRRNSDKRIYSWCGKAICFDKQLQITYYRFVPRQITSTDK